MVFRTDHTDVSISPNASTKSNNKWIEDEEGGGNAKWYQRLCQSLQIKSYLFKSESVHLLSNVVRLVK